jgi:phage FluMu protein Com
MSQPRPFRQGQHDPFNIIRCQLCAVNLTRHIAFIHLSIKIRHCIQINNVTDIWVHVSEVAKSDLWDKWGRVWTTL